MTEITQTSQINNTNPKSKHYDTTKTPGFAALSIGL